MRARFLLLLSCTITSVVLVPASGPSNDDITTLLVDDEPARIYRDALGVPHIFAETNRALFTAYGYVVAQDRLWQLEINRRASQGRLAEIFGRQVLSGDFLGVPENATVTADVADQNARTLGYTDQELDQQFARLTAEEQEIFEAYVNGINRYLTDVVAPNPFAKLPFEFHHLGLPVQEPWLVRDAVRFFDFVARLFGDAGGTERANQTLLNNLIAASIANGYPDPNAAALGMFNDLRWLNDPEAPTTIPTEGAIGKRQKSVVAPHPAQLAGASSDIKDISDDQAKTAWGALGVPTRLGSYGWAISAARSTNGFALFLGAPGLGFNAPEVVHEVQLTGGNGFHVTGVSFAGIPVVVIGRTDRAAWTQMTALADNVDTYVETLCSGGTGYFFEGVCTPYESRVEVIHVKNSASIALTVRRSLHGPVVGSGPGVRFTRRRGQGNRELEGFHAIVTAVRARNLEEFHQSVVQRPGAAHILYADNSGNIAFWTAGWIPERAAGFDPRFPLPGDGSAEWTGARLPIPVSINPARGWLANWNNKPSIDFDALEGGGFGRFNRVLDIAALLDGASLMSPQDMKEIVKDVARVDVVPTGPGRQARLLKPYLLSALDAIPPLHSMAPQARAVLDSWDGSALSNATDSTHLEPGFVIFNRWRAIMLQNTFGDELKGSAGQATVNVLLHVLDDALRDGGPCADLGGSCVPPSRDYFNGTAPNVVISSAFDQALSALGPDPAAWSNESRTPIDFTHYVVGPIAQIPGSARMTWVQNVILSRPALTAESILTLGQSGFVGLGLGNTPVLEAHFNDQLPIYRDFNYKPMRLYRNWQLH